MDNQSLTNRKVRRAMLTFAEAAERVGVQIPPHLEAQAEVPVISATAERPGHRQGDVIVVSVDGLRRIGRWTDPDGLANTIRRKGLPLGGRGYKVVEGDAERNAHILQSDSGAIFVPGDVTSRFDYGLLSVPSGGLAVLTHTGEHGSVAFSEGDWVVYGQVAYGAELARVAD